MSARLFAIVRSSSRPHSVSQVRRLRRQCLSEMPGDSQQAVETGSVGTLQSDLCRILE
jgi:hypothetical protein